MEWSWAADDVMATGPSKSMSGNQHHNHCNDQNLDSLSPGAATSKLVGNCGDERRLYPCGTWPKQCRPGVPMSLPFDLRRADTRPSSGLQLGSRDWHCPSASLFHGPGPARGSVWEPVSQLPPVHSGYVYYAVWKAVSAGP